MARSRLFTIYENTTQEKDEEKTVLFDELAQKINFALTLTKHTQSHFIKASRSFLMLAKFLPANEEIEKEVGKKNAGIDLIIQHINARANGLGTFDSLTEEQIKFLSPLHQRFFKPEFSSFFMLKLMMLCLMGSIGTLGNLGFAAKSLYSAPNSTGLKKSMLDLTYAVGFHFLIRLTCFAADQGERIKSAENVLGNQFQEIKKLCADYYFLTNGNHLYKKNDQNRFIYNKKG